VNLQGKVEIHAPRAKVWAFLTDPQAARECAPGLESLEELETGKKFRAVASVGLGGMRARFRMDVEWTEMVEPERAQMKVHGTAPGSTTDAVAVMKLTDAPEGTTLMEWSADVSVSGTIASLAARLMSSAATKLTGEFFDCVRRALET
jgi:carbon monoxide dehydrogenase subunit G